MPPAKPSKRTTGLGTFAGVFTPSILTILGIILFMRLGFVVGSGGLIQALLMIALANSISVLTSISLSAIATNLKVKGGGDYYLISRTLGVEYGGAIGIVLFLAQSVSVAFYTIGFGEAVAALTGGPEHLPQIIAAGAVAVLFLLAWLGADWATRFQYVVMGTLFAAISIFAVGAIGQFEWTTVQANLASQGVVPFWVLFAIFFPAVTGFTQGVSMSGDLQDPGRSLPIGTFLAVGVSLAVYLGAALLFAGSLSGELLSTDYGAMRRIAPLAWMIDAGVVAATLSSALSSFLGAPRILQSLARDKVFPILNPFAVGVGPTQNPRRGILLSLIIALGTILVGKLNVIAPVVSMFFLISYGLLNYATYVEAHSNSPSFRPRFHYFHQRLSLLGAVGCLAVMLAINPLAALSAVGVLFLIFQYVRRTAGPDRWADGARSARFQQVRNNLLAISDELAHARDWRPVILAFSNSPERRLRLLQFAEWLEGGSGFTTAVQIVRGGGPQVRRQRAEIEAEIRKDIVEHKLSAFVKAIVVEDPSTALPVLLQAHGLGGIYPNTVLFNWFNRVHPDEATRTASMIELRRALRYACNLILFSSDESKNARILETKASKRRIDVWYRDNATGILCLLLGYLMTRTDDWDSAQLRLLAPRRNGKSDEDTMNELTAMLDDVRIDAEPVLVDAIEPRAILHESLDATITLLPMRLGKIEPEGSWGGPLYELIESLGTTAFVLASEVVELESEPESGRQGETAEALDALDLARKQAAQAALDLDTLQRKLADKPDVEQSDSSIAAELEQARRRVAKADSKLASAQRAAEELTGTPQKNKD